jgi:hypothetical protein
MTSQLRLLTESDDPAYERLVLDAPQGMFVHSLAFGRFLARLLPDATGFRVGVFSNGELKGVVPAFARKGRFGTVVNSLPFFGSHGGMLTTNDCEDSLKLQLLNGFREHCSALGAVSATVIESPFEESAGLYEALKPTFTDDRIGQLSRLPQGPTADIRDILMNRLPRKTRNHIRKADREGFSLMIDGTADAFRKLHEIHVANMEAIGGTAKTWRVFEAIQETFVFERDYRLYLAKHGNGEVAAALLVFYWKDTVEYFTPVIHANHRSAQPLSMLIFTAMAEAVVEREARWWNWGGTWRSQEGVYTFKASWGAEDRIYRYHVITGEGFDALATSSRDEVLEAYPYFYTFPFK